MEISKCFQDGTWFPVWYGWGFSAPQRSLLAQDLMRVTSTVAAPKSEFLTCSLAASDNKNARLG